MTANPESVAIVAMGRSSAAWLGLAVNRGSRHRVTDEVWAINSMGAAIQHDRLFLMDDIKHKIKPLADENPEAMSAGLFDWLASHPGPIYTSRAYPQYPGTVEYPLQDVLASVSVPYLNSSVAYAVAYAMYCGVKVLHLYGCDFTYPDVHISEAGRACVELLLGVAGANGLRITVPSESTLLDACVPEGRKFYGYREDVRASRDVDESVVVTRNGQATKDADAQVPVAAMEARQ